MSSVLAVEQWSHELGVLWLNEQDELATHVVYTRDEAELRDAVIDDLRKRLVDMTCVGITIEPGIYRTNEAKIRNMACQAIHVCDAALRSTERGAR